MHKPENIQKECKQDAKQQGYRDNCLHVNSSPFIKINASLSIMYVSTSLVMKVCLFCEQIYKLIDKDNDNMILLCCEINHKQTYTPLFDREKFLPSPLLINKKRPCLETASPFFMSSFIYLSNIFPKHSILCRNLLY